MNQGVDAPRLDVGAKRCGVVGDAEQRVEEVVNFVISTDCALAAKMTSLLCICILVARK